MKNKKHLLSSLDLRVTSCQLGVKHLGNIRFLLVRIFVVILLVWVYVCEFVTS